ncbi:MAG: nucleotide exchange factor GrpE [Ignavibacteriae bacterium]|nr:nucleotide exchange factor GrpE [Ignavibacteriota bacterium]
MKKNEKHKDLKHEETEKIKVNIKENSKKEDDKSGTKSETEVLKEEARMLKDTLLRKAAEFENYKRRTEIDFMNNIKYASENLLKSLLPVYDDLIRSVESAEKGVTKDFDTLKQGQILIFEKFKAVFDREGLKEIEVLGKEFDVDLCDALLQVPKPGVKPNTVIEVVEKGYYLKDKVIRHAKVLVSADTPGIENSKE